MTAPFGSAQGRLEFVPFPSFSSSLSFMCTNLNRHDIHSRPQLFHNHLRAILEFVFAFTIAREPTFPQSTGYGRLSRL
jgi:hypothetical protein